jgi:hypothetical protein
MKMARSRQRIVNTRSGPERIIQNAIVAKLRNLNWLVMETHGNLFQWGFPDLYAAHYVNGTRWVEVKDPNRKGDVFTAAQHESFRALQAKGVGIWVLTSDSDEEIKKLFKPANWTHYLAMYR